jgi:hypothetical protein
VTDAATSKRTIESAWIAYEREVLPANAGRVQRVETRRAFYAGALALFSSVMRGLGPGTEATEDDLRMLDGIQSELAQFARDIAAGRA